MIPPYTLIRSKRRSLSIQIDASGGLIARAPMRMLVGSIESFIMAKRDWIAKHQTKRAATPPRLILSESDIHEAKKKLRDYIIPRVAELWEGTGLPRVTSIKITKSERRWGSCSARNGLCFSYRLAEWLIDPPVKGGCPIGQGGFVSGYQTPLYPPLTGGHRSEFIDAIIIHELAHLREKHHQRSFWDLVYSMMPEYESVMQNRENRD